MKRMLLAAATIFMALTANATTYKYLDAPGRNIKTTQVQPLPAGAIFILQYEGAKEPTSKDRYFRYRCFSRSGKGPGYDSDSKVGQNCNEIPLPAVLISNRVFAPTSFWYQPIPVNVALHPNTVGYQADFMRQYKRYANNVNINLTKWAAPVYTVGPDVAPVKVGFNNCQGKTFTETNLLKQLSAVPIPAYAKPAQGSDAEMAIYRPSTNDYWEMWKAVKKPDGSWIACWGGKLEKVNEQPGYMPKGYGTTATSLPFIGGQITAAELKAGKIEHAIGISLVETEHFSTYTWPAQRSDGWNPNNAPNRIPEGLRFRIDPTVDLDKLNLTKAGKIIAKAGQTYGFIVWDKAGSISIRAENPLGYVAEGKPNPYPELFENKASWAVLNNVPWSKLQFLPLNYGKP